MTREEEIIEKAGKESELFYNVNDNYGDCFHGGFIAGARWADAHPNPNTIKRLFEFALNNTNFLIAYNLDAIDCDKLVKQAMKK